MREVWVITDNAATNRPLSQAWHAATCTYTSTTSGISCTFRRLTQKDDVWVCRPKRMFPERLPCGHAKRASINIMANMIPYWPALANLVPSCPFPVLIWIRVQCPWQKSSRKLSAGWIFFFFCKSKYLNPGPQMTTLSAFLPRSFRVSEQRGTQPLWDKRRATHPVRWMRFCNFLIFPLHDNSCQIYTSKPTLTKMKAAITKCPIHPRSCQRRMNCRCMRKSAAGVLFSSFFFKADPNGFTGAGTTHNTLLSQKAERWKRRQNKAWKNDFAFGQHRHLRYCTAVYFCFAFFFSHWKKSQTEPTYLVLR